jgi:hypothetical protein
MLDAKAAEIEASVDQKLASQRAEYRSKFDALKVSSPSWNVHSTELTG